jgi:atypical dual specificity phosphatase
MSRAATRRATLLSPLSTTPTGGPSRSLDPTGTCGPVAVEIVPGVFLGDLAAAESAAVLSKCGITHVLSAMRGVVRIPSTHTCAHHQFPIEDNPFAELAAHLPAATAFVTDALRERPDGRVLIHCVQGVSRSAAVVAAYLVVRFGWTVEHAVAHIKSCRPAADPNFGFVKQIGEYAESLKNGAAR